MEASVTLLTQNNNHNTKLMFYKTNQSNILGNILILHGMAEHYGRYRNFIEELTNQGYDVYIYNHRGHGTDISPADLGYIADKKGATYLIEDARTVCRYIKETGRSKHLAVFGHSMGSLILRCLIQTYDEINCAIVSSSAMAPVAFSKLGGTLAGILSVLQGAKHPSPFLHNIMFGGKAYTSLCTCTDYDWLTRNTTVIDNYIADPYCGFVCPTGFYRDLARLSTWSAQKSRIKKTRKDLPILFLAGDKDPVGNYGAQIINLQKQFSDLGFSDTRIILYPECRHELLNELNAETVYQDIFSWLHTHLQ